MIFNDYFRRELRLLRETAKQFASDNPALAGAFLRASNDPDVERLFEGFAYLAAHLQQQLDNGSSGLFANLVSVLAPHLAKPVPVATLIEFTPRSNVTQALRVKAGSHVEARTADALHSAKSSRFRLCHSIDVLPVTVTDVTLEDDLPQNGGTPSTRLSLSLSAPVSLDAVIPGRLRIHVSGAAADAQEILCAIIREVSAIEIRDEQGRLLRALGPEHVTHAGLEARKDVFSPARGSLPAIDAFREYFLFPELFQFMDLDLGGALPEGYQTIKVVFRFTGTRQGLPAVDKSTFRLNVCPAVNLFSWDAEPIVMTHRQTSMAVLPLPKGDSDGPRPDIYSIDEVSGLVIGGGSRKYHALDANTLEQTELLRYMTETRQDGSSTAREHWITPLIPSKHEWNQREVMSLKLTCSDGERAARIPVGDINVNIGETPELLTFRNIVPSTRQRHTSDGQGHYWQLLSDMNAHRCELSDAGQLCAFLTHQLVVDASDDMQAAISRRRIAAIENVSLSAERRLYRDAFVSGRRVRVTLRNDHFASLGDKRYFSMLLLYLYESTAAFNTFVVLETEDSLSGAVETLPMSMGGRAAW
jgi:type VI secretion system protein ImpG